MKLSDYIIKYLKEIGIKDYFGYQGTMIAHFVDSIGKDKDVYNHVCYHEQGAAFEAIGYAKTTGKTACAYATSGPGATNLITGIADAYYDSVPVLFITGQLNTYEYSDVSTIRQQGFQESDIVSISKPITKYSKKITNPNDIAYELEKAIYISRDKRPGPVLLDIPMNIQREEIDLNKLKHFNIKEKNKVNYSKICKEIVNHINSSNRPVLILGNGINKDDNSITEIRKMIKLLKIPVLYSMLGKIYIEEDCPYNFGFMGSAYGQRYANIIGCAKADLIVSFGCRLNGRTIGLKKEKFNPKSKIIRIEIDSEELKLKIHNNDIVYKVDVNELIIEMNKYLKNKKIDSKKDWILTCNKIKDRLKDIDNDIDEWLPNRYVNVINKYMLDDSCVYADVGQNQIWAAHSIKIRKKQKIIFSGGLGSMGFALPAAIGGCIGNKKKRTFAIVGDGGMQMNIQELQLLKQEKLPVTIIVFNNASLGLIHQQQCDFFDKKYYGSCNDGKYTVPDFEKIAKAYGIKSYKVNTISKFKKVIDTCNYEEPNLIEIILPVGTKAYPKTFFGNSMINQKPELSDKLLEEILNY